MTTTHCVRLEAALLLLHSGKRASVVMEEEEKGGWEWEEEEEKQEEQEEKEEKEPIIQRSFRFQRPCSALWRMSNQHTSHELHLEIKTEAL
jgi:hypothetical protein